MFPHGETVSVITAGTTVDPYSSTSTAEDWNTPVSVVPVAGVGVEPRPSGEPVQDARNAVTSGYSLYMPVGTAVTARNRVIVRGGTYAVLGEPAVWVNPFTGWEPGLVVQCERIEG